MMLFEYLKFSVLYLDMRYNSVCYNKFEKLVY